MKKILFLLISLYSFSCTPTVQENISYASVGNFQLAPPLLSIDSILFQNNTTITLEMAHPNVEIRYTLDGSEVNESSSLYQSPIVISTSGSIRAKAFHTDFKESEEILQDFLKASKVLKDATITVAPEPHSSYKGGGANALIDLQKGTTNFRKGKFWSGFKSKEIVVDINLKEKQSFSNISLSVLKDHRAWIFLPKRVEIYANDKEIGVVTLEEPIDFEPPKVTFITIPTKNITTNHLQIKIINLPIIPDFHSGKGTTPWLFIDEVLFE